MIRRIQCPQSPELSYESIRELMLISKSLGRYHNGRLTALAEQGEHKVKTRGHGLELKELRTYQTTDEPRHIDWRVSARAGEPYTRVFEEEKEHSHLLITELSANSYFGTQETFISTRYAQLSALIGGRIKHLKDSFGYLLEYGNTHIFDASTRDWHTFQVALTDATQIAQRQNKTTPHLVSIQSLPIKLRSKNLLILTDKVSVSTESKNILKRLSKSNQIIWITIEDRNAIKLPEGVYSFMTPSGHSTRYISESNTSTPTSPYQESMLHLQKDLTALGIRNLRFDITDSPLSIASQLIQLGSLR